jgi:hypothetical protein
MENRDLLRYWKNKLEKQNADLCNDEAFGSTTS